MINTINLPPFKKLCITVGNLPSSFMESMSYYEALCWLVNYLDKELIPAVNTNSEAITELQNYVENYFENLDVQEEINNKLDHMASSGELTDIIAQYLQLAGVLAFDTVTSMKAAENLVNGSTARTLGESTYLDGKGAFYKIRTLINTDVVDEINIISLTNYPTLIAELIPNYDISQIKSRLSLLDNKKVIMIGDSYANRTNSWQDRLKVYMGLSDSDCVLNRASGTGFIATTDGKNFNTMLTSDVTIPASEVTDIIVCGGMNDRFHTTTEISSAISSFISLAHTTYPNAQVYLGFISWITPEFSETYSNTVGTLNNICNLWKNAAVYGKFVHYLNNVEYTLHNIANIDDSHAHPTDTGQLLLAQNIMTAWVTGSCDVEQSSVFGITANTTGNITAVSGQFLGFISNGISYLKASEPIGVTFNSTAFSLGSTKIDLGTLNGGFLMGKSYATATTVGCLINLYTTGYIKIPCTLYVNDGHLYLKIQATNSAGWINERVTQFTINEFEIIGSSMQQY